GRPSHLDFDQIQTLISVYRYVTLLKDLETAALNFAHQSVDGSEVASRNLIDNLQSRDRIKLLSLRHRTHATNEKYSSWSKDPSHLTEKYLAVIPDNAMKAMIIDC